jgi:hypothetical protein
MFLHRPTIGALPCLGVEKIDKRSTIQSNDCRRGTRSIVEMTKYRDMDQAACVDNRT